jgi:hypothetical protein
MNDLDVLAEFRAGTPGPDAAALAHARAAMFEAPSTATRRGSWPWATAAGLAAAAVIVVAIVAVRPAPPGAAVGAARATSVLQLAARQARGSTPLAPRGDQFLFIESVNALRQGQVGADGNPPLHTWGSRRWVSVDRSQDVRERQRPNAFSGPWTKPVSIGQNLPTTTADRGLPTCTAPKWCTAEPAYLPDLPADVAGMRAFIHRRANTPDSVGAAFYQIRVLLERTAMPPAQLAALYEAAATLPGLTVVPDAIDAAGRHGVAVAHASRPDYQDELIFDRIGHQFLGSAQVTTTAHGKVPAGTVIMATARLRTAVVDKPDELPR